ncbi:hypothetical protein [Allomuricauda sp. d1]|uniref:hypothetical protein n=1 Tax=Allomuricauda sp. d1 TaxID=3136725 RepID=UPI0031D13B40
MHRIYTYLWVAACLIMVITASCRKDFDYPQSSGQLQFSKDTVFLDTVFTNIGSSTYTLKVYNSSSDDVQIPFIGLKNGLESGYRLNVDGLPGKEFSDIPILAKDSLFVFIETTFGITTVGDNEFLYTDAIQFGTEATRQEVQLVTLVKDAVFLYPRTLSNGMKETLLLGFDEEGNEIRIEGFFLEDAELNFSNEKPYVVYGYAAVAEDRALTIDAGARIHFHKDSGIIVTSGGSLNANGSLSEDQELSENEIIFEGDRLEPDFSEVPGQWGTIWLAEGSRANSLDYVTIKNATVGVLVDGSPEASPPTLTLRNSKIQNSSSVNLWGRNTSIEAQNLVAGSAGEISVYCNLGGNYDFKHATIANYWNDGFRSGPSLLIDNFVETASTIESMDLERANFANCIIYGNRSVELQLADNGSKAFDFNFKNCLIRFEDSNGTFDGNPLYDFENPILYENLLVNGRPGFSNPFAGDFSLTTESEAIDNGDVQTALEVPLDIFGNDRTLSPDLGVFEFFPNN